MTARAVLNERQRMRRTGFKGTAGYVYFCAGDGRSHNLRVVEYTFPDRRIKKYVELWEAHDRARRARILPLADLVHVVQNLSADELKTAANRKRPRK